MNHHLGKLTHRRLDFRSNRPAYKWFARICARGGRHPDFVHTLWLRFRRRTLRPFPPNMFRLVPMLIRIRLRAHRLWLLRYPSRPALLGAFKTPESGLTP